MKDILVLLATMGGGLGCFLLGMKHLSEGLQSVGGAGLKRFMSAMTTNRIAGMMTGVVSTIIVQSSSIITVMTVGFVSSGLMDLTQAVNVHTGFNIVTTLCFLPFTAPFAAFVKRIVKERKTVAEIRETPSVRSRCRRHRPNTCCN